MTFDLPMPPTSNTLFATVVVKGTPRRITTRAYKAWRTEAADMLGRQYAAYGAPGIHKPVRLLIMLGLNYQSDIANREKALTDLLVEHLDMPDDRYIDDLRIVRDQSIEGARVTIEGSYAGEARSIGEIIRPIVDNVRELSGADCIGEALERSYANHPEMRP